MRFSRAALAAVFLAPALLAVVVFTPALWNKLLYDDPAALELARAPVRELLAHRYGLTYLSIRLDQALWGGSAVGFHLTNLVLHAVCSGLAGVLALELTGRWTVGVFAGALFAVHPVHVEAVASVENRKELLAMAGVLASVLLYRARRHPAWTYGGALIALVLAMHAKDAAAAGAVALLPLAGLLPEPGEGPPWRVRLAATMRRIVPVLVVGLVATAWYGGNLLEKFDPDVIRKTTVDTCRTYAEALGTSAAAVPEAARLLVFPARLSADYPTPSQPGPWTPRALAGIALVLAWGGGAVLLARHHPVVAFAIAWVPIMYLPVSNVVPLSAYFVAERYLYAPSFGICLLVALGLDQLTRRGRPRLTAAAATVLVLAAAVRSEARIQDWRDSLTLWTAALRDVPGGSERIHGELGMALWRAGRAAEAVPHLERAVELQPTRADERNNLGLALLQLGRPAEAIPHFQRALELWPRNPLIRFNLATALLETGRREEAIAEFRAVAREDAWQDLQPAVHAALTERGMSAEEFRARVLKWLAKNADAAASGDGR